jgi:ferrochelatase
MKKGVLLTSLGSPERLEDMEAYLLDIRHGRPVSHELLSEVTERYKLAGGKSPLLEITQRQAKALEQRLNKNGEDFKVYVGMRHWHPYIHDVMKQIIADGIEILVSLPLTPYYSYMSTEAYHAKVREAKEKLGGKMEIIYVESWNVEPFLIEAYAEVVQKGLEKFPPGTSREKIKVLFTAHSLPSRILNEGDPYQDELLETIDLVAKRLNLSQWDFAYQSQGASNEPWLGPKVEEMLEKYAEEKLENVLIVPIGFVCDHMEILYDVDIAFKKLAKEKNIHLERSDSLNDSPKFIQAMESVVLQSLNSVGSKVGQH